MWNDPHGHLSPRFSEVPSPDKPYNLQEFVGWSEADCQGGLEPQWFVPWMAANVLWLRDAGFLQVRRLRDVQGHLHQHDG